MCICLQMMANPMGGTVPCSRLNITLMNSAGFMQFDSNTYGTFVVDVGPTLYEEFGNTLESTSTGCS